MRFERKQFAVVALLVLIISAGYLQYTANKTDNVGLGESVYVNSDITESGEQENKETEKNKEVEEEEYFAQAKLNRNNVRSKAVETLKQITEDENADEDSKANAYKKMVGLTTDEETEIRIEELIKEKGFEDVIVIIGENREMDIVVKTDELTSNMVNKIADIASRQAGIDMNNIHIRNKS